MITEQHKDTAQWAMRFALQNGCQATRVSIITANNNSFEYRNTQLDKLHQSSENKLYIEFFVDGKYGTFSTNRIEKAGLETFIKEGIISTGYLAPDTLRQLPNPDRYYKGDSKGLDLYDNSFENISTDKKLDIARQAVEEIYESDKRIISITSSYDDGVGAEYMIASNGFEAESIDSAFNLTVEVALKTDSDARAESYWFDSSIYWDDRSSNLRLPFCKLQARMLVIISNINFILESTSVLLYLICFEVGHRQLSASSPIRFPYSFYDMMVIFFGLHIGLK